MVKATLDLRCASRWTRLLYCIGLVSFVPATLLASSGWIGLTFGRTGGGLFGMLVLLSIAAAVVFRIYQVFRYPHALDGFVSNKLLVTLRGLCIAGMLVGGLAGLVLFFISPLASLISTGPGDFGVAFYLVGVYGVLVSPLGWKACLAFEATRWVGKALYGDPRPDSPYQWNQDGIVAALLLVVFFGGAFLLSASVKSDLAHACGQDRIGCVATVKEELPRMVSLPMGSPVSLVSNIDSIRMQMHSGGHVKWEVVESVSNSLSVSGYEPAADESLPVMVSIRASETGEGILLDVRVTENGEQASRLSAVFPESSRLETDARGRLNLITSLPPRSDSVVFGDRRQITDQLFVFFRRAIGTEVEAQESRLRIAGTPLSVKRVDGGGAQIRSRRQQGSLVCDSRLEMVQSKVVRSFALATRGWELMELRFASNPSRGPLTYVNRGDAIVCTPQAIWIVQSAPIDPQFTVKRFSPEGKLERFVEGTLPIVASDGVYGRIDDQSLREEGGAVWFDRIEERVETDRDVREILVARETFKVQVQPN